MAKRGRKPKNTVENKNYFDAEQEQALKDYLSCTDECEKERIYNTKLDAPFTKMIESIIRRYQLRLPNESFEETFNDAKSYLLTKIERFDSSKNTKAYSYCGTICKNHVVNRMIKFQKLQNKSADFDSSIKIINDMEDDIETIKDEKNHFISDLINETIQNIKDTIENGKLNDNDKKIGYTIIDIFENWETMFSDNDGSNKMGSNKFNKNYILYYIRENTQLGPKQVADGLKKFKKIYLLTKESLL